MELKNSPNIKYTLEIIFCIDFVVLISILIYLFSIFMANSILYLMTLVQILVTSIFILLKPNRDDEFYEVWETLLFILILSIFIVSIMVFIYFNFKIAEIGLVISSLATIQIFSTLNSYALDIYNDGKAEVMTLC